MTDTINALDFLRIGHIAAPHGLDGLVRVAVVTDVESRFTEATKVLLDEKGVKKEYTVQSFALHKPKVGLLKLEGIDSREDSERISGCDILFLKSDAENSRDDLAEGEFYYFDLIGCSVYKDGSLFGSVSGIFEGGSGHILECADDKGEKYMIPFVDGMVNTDKVSERRVDIYPVDGLLDK